MTPIDFHYRPTCSAPGCDALAVYKVAASWSDGMSWELKNYGLSCEAHRLSQLARGKVHRQGLLLGDGEVVGQVGLFELQENARDAAPQAFQPITNKRKPSRLGWTPPMSHKSRFVLVIVALHLAGYVQAADPPPTPGVKSSRGPGVFAQFELPDAWEARFWDDADTKALLKLEPKALAELVPIQAGLRFCRCPACDADETIDPLIWSATKPASLTCSRCGQTFPNEKIPASKDKKVPEEVVEVLPGKQHHYPYHVPAAEELKYPDERLYLDAKRDYEKREALARERLYAAVRFHEHKAKAKADPALARFAAILILRFAQVYPAYATHFDQPNQPKFLQTANLGPPFRRGYRTGKWEWMASIDVPLNLLTAYALIRDEPSGRKSGDC